MNWDWTDHDRHTAEQFRLARLRSLIPQLRTSILHLDLEYVLRVYIYNQLDAAALTLFAEEFQQQVYVVLGCRQVSVWFENELAFERTLDLQSALTLDVDEDEDTRMIATAERTETASPEVTVAQVAQVAQSSTLPGQTIAAIAEDTDQPVESIQSWVAEHGWPMIPFNGDLIISGEAAIAALDHFSEVLKQQRLAKRGLLPVSTPAATNGKATAPTVEPTPAPPPRATKAKSPTRARPSRSTLALPPGYASKIVRGQTRTNFERALPNKPEIRAQYLEEVANETEKGKDFVDRIVNTIIKKFKGNKEKLTANILQMAKKMQAEPQAS